MNGRKAKERRRKRAAAERTEREVNPSQAALKAARLKRDRALGTLGTEMSKKHAELNREWFEERRKIWATWDQTRDTILKAEAKAA